MDNQDTQAPGQEPAGLKKPEADPLAQKWAKSIAAARKHWKPMHVQMRKNRTLVRDLKFGSDDGPTKKRANLMLSTMSASIPNIYAKNPEISVTPRYTNQSLKLLCTTLETVTNRALTDAKLKKRAKSLLFACMTCYYGILKVSYQRDIQTDPLIESRINDTQDNIVRLEQLIQEADDPDDAGDHETKLAELKQTMMALQEQTEVVAAEGLVIDKVLSENLILDPTVCEFDDYDSAGWMAQIVPMRRSYAEGLYKVDLSGALAYKSGEAGKEDRRIASADLAGGDDDPQIAILEIWDKQSQRVYTMADGCNFWCREPYSPAGVGERWYPFFLFPFSLVDGDFVGPCFVDLTRKLEEEYNETRDKFAAHRELNKPGLVVNGGDVKEKDIRKIANGELGEIITIDSDASRPLNQLITAKPTVPLNPMDYDTGAIRNDWEQVTGLQDAARSTVVSPKTATEAQIMQQSLSGRVSEMRDRMEDYLQELAQYGAQILLFNLTPKQVARYMGPGKQVKDPATGAPMEQPSYDWPELSRDDIFNMVQLEIRAGTTGAPDKLRLQENWSKALPILLQLIQQIMQLAAQGIDFSPLQAILEETLRRFDERIDIEEFLPKAAPQQAAPAMPAGPGVPQGVEGGQGLPPQLRQLLAGAAGPQGPQQSPAAPQSGLPPPPPAMAQLLAQGA